MKTKKLICSVLGAGLIAAGLTGCETEKAEQARLQTMAKVSRVDAEKTALTKAPGGTVKEGELEEENGKLIWSFDITTPGTKEITEVGVDALTGEVVSTEKESEEHEAKEKSEKK